MKPDLSPKEQRAKSEGLNSLGYPERLLEPGQTQESITAKIAGIPLEQKQPKSWIVGFIIAFFLTLIFLASTAYLLVRGVGIWGVNIPVAWAFAIVNFVWWIGIGHAGTLISAILLLLMQPWRQSINRFAEAMTLFAVVCAGLFPLLHLGRPWVFYWMVPYPDTMGLWPQFRSPLVWDFFAVFTYFTVSLLFWYLGMLPDLGTMRDRAKSRWMQVIYGVMAMGWRGSARHWHRYRILYLLLAGLATPLVVSVHSIVSMDFAVTILPGWHSTLFPPYFVAGAVYSGIAMVLTIVIPVRRVYGLHSMITARHLNSLACILLVTGLMVAYAYIMETFFAWYSGDESEQFLSFNRAWGPYGKIFWGMLFCNVVLPQALWFRRVRLSPGLLLGVALFVNVGMWTERFVIVVVSLHRDFLPSSWGMYQPTIWDYASLFGSMGLFLLLLLLFIRFLPLISITEVRGSLSETRGNE